MSSDIKKCLGIYSKHAYVLMAVAATCAIVSQSEKTDAMLKNALTRAGSIISGVSSSSSTRAARVALQTATTRGVSTSKLPTSGGINTAAGSVVHDVTEGGSPVFTTHPGGRRVYFGETDTGKLAKVLGANVDVEKKYNVYFEGDGSAVVTSTSSGNLVRTLKYAEIVRGKFVDPETGETSRKIVLAGPWWVSGSDIKMAALSGGTSTGGSGTGKTPAVSPTSPTGVTQTVVSSTSQQTGPTDGGDTLKPTQGPTSDSQGGQTPGGNIPPAPALPTQQGGGETSSSPQTKGPLGITSQDLSNAKGNLKPVPPTENGDGGIDNDPGAHGVGPEDLKIGKLLLKPAVTVDKTGLNGPVLTDNEGNIIRTLTGDGGGQSQTPSGANTPSPTSPQGTVTPGASNLGDADTPEASQTPTGVNSPSVQTPSAALKQTRDAQTQTGEGDGIPPAPPLPETLQDYSGYKGTEPTPEQLKGVKLQPTVIRETGGPYGPRYTTATGGDFIFGRSGNENEGRGASPSASGTVTPQGSGTPGVSSLGGDDYTPVDSQASTQVNSPVNPQTPLTQSGNGTPTVPPPSSAGENFDSGNLSPKSVANATVGTGDLDSGNEGSSGKGTPTYILGNPGTVVPTTLTRTPKKLTSGNPLKPLLVLSNDGGNPYQETTDNGNGTSTSKTQTVLKPTGNSGTIPGYDVDHDGRDGNVNLSNTTSNGNGTSDSQTQTVYSNTAANGKLDIKLSDVAGVPTKPESNEATTQTGGPTDPTRYTSSLHLRITGDGQVIPVNPGDSGTQTSPTPQKQPSTLNVIVTGVGQNTPTDPEDSSTKPGPGIYTTTLRLNVNGKNGNIQIKPQGEGETLGGATQQTPQGGNQPGTQTNNQGGGTPSGDGSGGGNTPPSSTPSQTQTTPEKKMVDASTQTEEIYPGGDKIIPSNEQAQVLQLQIGINGNKASVTTQTEQSGLAGSQPTTSGTSTPTSPGGGAGSGGFTPQDGESSPTKPSTPTSGGGKDSDPSPTGTLPGRFGVLTLKVLSPIPEGQEQGTPDIGDLGLGGSINPRGPQPPFIVRARPDVPTPQSKLAASFIFGPFGSSGTSGEESGTTQIGNKTPTKTTSGASTQMGGVTGQTTQTGDGTPTSIIPTGSGSGTPVGTPSPVTVQSGSGTPTVVVPGGDGTPTPSSPTGVTQAGSGAGTPTGGSVSGATQTGDGTPTSIIPAGSGSSTPVRTPSPVTAQSGSGTPTVVVPGGDGTPTPSSPTGVTQTGSGTGTSSGGDPTGSGFTSGLKLKVASSGGRTTITPSSGSQDAGTTSEGTQTGGGTPGANATPIAGSVSEGTQAGGGGPAGVIISEGGLTSATTYTSSGGGQVTVVSGPSNRKVNILASGGSNITSGPGGTSVDLSSKTEVVTQSGSGVSTTSTSDASGPGTTSGDPGLSARLLKLLKDTLGIGNKEYGTKQSDPTTQSSQTGDGSGSNGTTTPTSPVGGDRPGSPGNQPSATGGGITPSSPSDTGVSQPIPKI